MTGLDRLRRCLASITPLHLVALWGFAVAQPLYDLFARFPAFLTAHGLLSWSLIGYCVLLSLVLPGLLALLMYLVRTVLPLLGHLLTTLLATLLILLFGLPIIWGVGPDGTEGIDTIFLLRASGAGLLTLVLVGLILRFSTLRQGLNFALVGVVAFPLIFLLSDPVRPLLPTVFEDRQDLKLTRVDSGTPLPDIVMVVFDELPLSALLNGGDRIDGKLFPNFATLAEQSDWYAQASTVASRTEAALPSLLRGRFPAVPHRAPTAAAYPNNLFALLRPYYELDVVESFTSLCEGLSCRMPRLNGWQLAADATLVYAHIVVPRPLRARLPSIDGQWADFGANAQPRGVADLPSEPVADPLTDARAPLAAEFFSGLSIGDRPKLSFLHSLLPHAPYLLLPGGRRLFRLRETGEVKDATGLSLWPEDATALTEAKQFFLWQLQYVDDLIGLMIERLRANDRFDNTLLIVTADHGISLRPGEYRRLPTPTNLVDIAVVPLLVKRVGQQHGRRLDGPMLLTDLVPTLLRELGFVPAAASVTFHGRPYEAAAGDTTTGDTTVPRRTLTSAREKLQLPAHFDLSDGQVLWPAATGQRLNAAPAMIERRCAFADEVKMVHPQLYENVSFEAFLPAHALLTGTRALTGELFVEFNGVLFAATASGANDHSAFLAPNLFKAGFNRIRVLGRTHVGWCLVYANHQAH